MTATVTLYERTEALNILDAYIAEHADEIAANDGVLPAEIEALLNDAEGEWEAKVEAVALYIKSAEHTAGAVAAERDRLAMRVKALDNAATGLKAYLKANLEAAGREKVERPLATVAIQKSPPSVTSSLDLSALFTLHKGDSPFVRYVPATVALDRTAVIAAYRRGEALPEGVSIETSVHLRIR